MAKLAINGGDRVCTNSWPTWPIAEEGEKQALCEVVESLAWGIGGSVGEADSVSRI